MLRGGRRSRNDRHRAHQQNQSPILEGGSGDVFLSVVDPGSALPVLDSVFLAGVDPVSALPVLDQPGRRWTFVSTSFFALAAFLFASAASCGFAALAALRQRGKNSA